MESLAVKYRPKTFDEVVGQENIIAILKNQLERKDTKQGYLFTGGAGTGKTTIARIFARLINNQQGEPIEIDAASNNGVDHVREIREACKFKPIGAEYKVYIIDEVHMLSTGAFNALLKTLEEPPAHVVFILCTTDPQKIPPTILSRVQRFDFKRQTVEQITTQLLAIVDWEKRDITGEAAEYIAKLANGGMRDAISLMDTCLGYSKSVGLNEVFETLGQAGYRVYLQLANHLAGGDEEKIIELVEQLHIDGRDLKQFVKGFTELVVELKKIQVLQSYEYCSIPSTYFSDIEWIMKNQLDLDKWFKSFSELESRIKYERHPKVLIEGWLLTL